MGLLNCQASTTETGSMRDLNADEHTLLALVAALVSLREVGLAFKTWSPVPVSCSSGPSPP